MVDLEVCFSPALFPAISLSKPYAVVVVDILRATTSICTAFEHGVKEVIPVSTLEEALQYKEEGYLVAGERDGSKLPFADAGNAPARFMGGEFAGKSVVFTTTNGTVAMNLAHDAGEMAIGAFSNLGVLSEWLQQQGKKGLNVLILCAGWYNQFSLEDSVFAGCLSERLLDSGQFNSNSDSVLAALDLWHSAQPNVFEYLRKASHSQRLITLKVATDADLEYCFTPDTVTIVPVREDKRLVVKTNQRSG